MALEESFGVAISDAEAVKCETPADVIDMVLGKLRASEDAGCVSQRGFYVLRKALTETLGIERSSVTLGLDIGSLVSEKSDRAIWESLKVATDARSWPSLVRPRWLVVSLWLLTGIVLVGLFRVTDPAIAWVGALLIGCVGVRFTRRFENQIPRTYSKVRELVPFAVTSGKVSWSRAEVATLVKKLVMEQLGVSEEQYREDAHFIEDFGMDR